MKGIKKILVCLFLMMVSSLALGKNLDLSHMSLQDIKGNTYTFGENGRPTYVKLWGSWCEICMSGLRDVELLSQEKNDFDVVTVVFPKLYGERKTKDFIFWFNSLGYNNMKVLIDEKGELAKAVNLRAFPTSLVLSKEGKVRLIIPGHIENEDVKGLFE